MNITRRVFVVLFLFIVLLLSFAALAHAQGGGTLNNPLNSNASSIPQFIASALKALVIIALPFITLFFVYSGFLFIKARGNPGELATAKMNFVYLIIGTLLILGAWILAALLAGTVNQLTGNSASVNSQSSYNMGNTLY